MIGLVPVYGLFVGGIVAEESTLFIPAAIGGLLVTPIAHWTHGNRGRGWVSFGLNLGAPMLGLFVAGGYGALAGFGLWNVVDVAALHYERKPAALVNRTPNIVHSWAIVPMMDHGRRGIGLVGQF